MSQNGRSGIGYLNQLSLAAHGRFVTRRSDKEVSPVKVNIRCSLAAILARSKTKTESESAGNPTLPSRSSPVAVTHRAVWR